MLHRIAVLLRARIASQREGGLLPAAPILMLGFVSAVMCLLVRDMTTPFAYALIALTVNAALIATPLLGDFGSLLTADETGDWLRALPVRPIEIHAARALHLLLALAVLSTGGLAPAALLAPEGVGWIGKATLFAAGITQSLFIAAALLIAQTALRERAHALLVALQTALFVTVLVGSVAGLEFVATMREWSGPGATERLAWFPPAWFAAQLSDDELSIGWSIAAWAAGVGALVALLGIPAPGAPSGRAGSTLLGAVLTPLRKLAARAWVRGRERATFEFVFDALAKEREFVLRAYPLLAVPLGFLVLGAREGDAASKEGLLALLFFIPGAYAPLLVAHTPGTGSPRARWILDTAPATRAELENGAIKAVAIRFLLPLYFVLAALGFLQGRWETSLRLAPAGFVASVIVARLVWRRCAPERPLSIPHDELRIDNDWIGMLAVIAFALILVSLAAVRWLDSWPASLALIGALVAIEFALDRALAAERVQAGA